MMHLIQNDLLLYNFCMSNETLYIEIAKQIQTEIENNLTPGTRLPSESFYQQKFGVARMTITRALQYLEKEKIIYRIKNKGYFVLKESYARGNEILSYSELNSKYGLRTRNDVISIELIIPDEKIARYLELNDDEKVYCIERLRYRNDVPTTIEHAHIVEKYARGLEKFNFSEFSLYQVLREFYGINIDRQVYEISASSTNRSESELLKIKKGSPVSIVTTRGYTNLGMTPIEYTKQVSTARFSVELRRD